MEPGLQQPCPHWAIEKQDKLVHLYLIRLQLGDAREWSERSELLDPHQPHDRCILMDRGFQQNSCGKELATCRRRASTGNYRSGLNIEPEVKRTEEASMSTSSKPLKPDDFSLHVEGDKIKKQDGKPVAKTEDPAVAADVADRLNEDEGRREEDKWSA
jgi:hypothetical protein